MHRICSSSLLLPRRPLLVGSSPILFLRGGLKAPSFSTQQDASKPRARGHTRDDDSDYFGGKRLLVGMAALTAVYVSLAGAFFIFGDPSDSVEKRSSTGGRDGESIVARLLHAVGLLDAASPSQRAREYEEYLREDLPSAETLKAQRRAWRPTLIIQMEGLSMQTPYDPRYGYGLALRPGFLELLLDAGNAGWEVVLWSSERSGETATRLFQEKILPLLVRMDAPRYVSFTRHLNQQLRDSNQRRRIHAENAGLPTPPSRNAYQKYEVDEQYAKALLRIHGILGVEHGEGVPAGSTLLVLGGVDGGVSITKAPSRLKKDLAALPRDLDDVLLLDCDVSSAHAFPSNTLLIPAMAPIPSGMGGRVNTTSKRQGMVPNPCLVIHEAGSRDVELDLVAYSQQRQDPTLFLISDFIKLYRAKAGREYGTTEDGGSDAAQIVPRLDLATFRGDYLRDAFEKGLLPPTSEGDSTPLDPLLRETDAILCNIAFQRREKEGGHNTSTDQKPRD